MESEPHGVSENIFSYGTMIDIQLQYVNAFKCPPVKFL